MSLDPKPTRAGSEAPLLVGAAGLGPELIVGVGVAWQCWDGSDWVDTHFLVVGIEGFEPEVAAVER